MARIDPMKSGCNHYFGNGSFCRKDAIGKREFTVNMPIRFWDGSIRDFDSLKIDYRCEEHKAELVNQHR